MQTRRGDPSARRLSRSRRRVWSWESRHFQGVTIAFLISSGGTRCLRATEPEFVRTARGSRSRRRCHDWLMSWGLRVGCSSCLRASARKSVAVGSALDVRAARVRVPRRPRVQGINGQSEILVVSARRTAQWQPPAPDDHLHLWALGIRTLIVVPLWPSVTMAAQSRCTHSARRSPTGCHVAPAIDHRRGCVSWLGDDEALGLLASGASRSRIRKSRSSSGGRDMTACSNVQGPHR